jgi:hypothetical protein
MSHRRCKRNRALMRHFVDGASALAETERQVVEHARADVGALASHRGEARRSTTQMRAPGSR